MRPIDYFDTATEQYANRPALITSNGALTFAEVKGLSGRATTWLSGVALRTEQLRIGIMSPNDYRVVVFTLAAMRGGHAVVPIHAGASLESVTEIVARARIDVMCYHSSLSATFSKRDGSLSAVKSWVCMDSGQAVTLEPESASPDACSVVPDWGGVQEESDRPVFLRATSGTTGQPKVVIDTIRSFNATQRVLRHMLGAEAPGTVFLAVAPLSHASGVYAFSVLSCGGAVLVATQFDPEHIIGQIAEHRVTHLWLPPAAMSLLLASSAARQLARSSLKAVMVGAAATPPAKLCQAVGTFGPCVSVNYSQIEAGFLTWLDADTVAAAVRTGDLRLLSSCGKSMFVSRVAIMGPDGALLPNGTIGEIVVRGASVKDYEDSAATSLARAHGWHHTGDMGARDDDGFFYITGRTKDVIISAGMKVWPSDVEAAILRMTDVNECAVVAIPDAVRGEAIGAVVVMREGHRLDRRAAAILCRELLGRGRCPHVWHEWDALPRTAVGKIDAREVARRLRGAAAGAESVGDVPHDSTNPT